MSYIQQFFTSRDNNANAETFVGQEGRLWWDPVTNQIYSSDGNTPGGIPLAGGGGGGSPGGSNSQVQFNNSGTFGGSSLLTFNRVTGALTAVSFAGDGGTLSNIAGANVVGEVSNATYASSAVNAVTAETVSSSEQPNITGVGILSVLSVSGNITGNYFIGNGSQLTGISGGLPLSNGTSNFDIATADGVATITIGGTRTFTFGQGYLDIPKFGVYEEPGRIRGNGLQLRGDTNGGGSLAYIILPNNDDAVGNAVTVGNDVGNVVIWTGGPTWTFNNNGDLILPGNAYVSGDNDRISLYANIEVELDGISIQTNDLTNIFNQGNVSIIANEGDNGRVWEFDNTGTLTTPGDITVGGDITGTSGASTLIFKAQPNSDTAIQLNNTVDSAIRTVANLEIRTNVSNTAQLWNFDTTGNLSAPSDISAVGNIAGNYILGNGSQLTGLSATYGNANVATFLSAFGSNVISTTGNVTGGNLLTSGVVEFAGGSRLRPTGANLDIVAGAGSYVNLITSDDSSYMGVDGAGGYVVAAGRSWRFNTDGTTTFPNNNINTGANPITLWSTDSSSLLWRDAAGGAPSQPVQTIIEAGNGAATITVSTGVLAIQSQKIWTFDTAGNTTFPDATVQTTAYPGTSSSLSLTGNITGGNVLGTTSVSVSGTGGDLTMTGGAITGVGNITSNGIMAINAPGGITTTQASFDIVNATATTVNLGGSATAVNIGATTGTLTINNPNIVATQASIAVFNTTATAANIFGAASTIIMGAAGAGTLTLRNGTIVGSQATQNLFNTVATTVNFAGAANTLAIAAGATPSGTTKTIGIGENGVANSITNINFGTAAGNGNVTFSANTLVRVANTSGTALSVAGNVTGGNVLSNGQLSTAGNITGGNISIGGNFTTPGNIGASYINGAYYTGTWSTNFQALGNISTVGNVVSGNVLNSGIMSSTGNVTGANLISTGAVYSNYNTNTANTASFMAQGGNTKGGTGYLDFLVAQNTSGGATVPYKWLRTTSDGQFQIINSAYTQNIFNLTDGGNVAIPGQLFINGAQTTNGPAFSAYAAAILQTIPNNAQTKVLFQTEEFDTNSNYTNSIFTPTVAGYYQLNAEVRLDGSSGTGEMMIILYKNGAEYKRGTNQSGTQIASNFWAMQVSSVAYANGLGDYFEIYVQQGSGGSISVTAVNNSAITWFNGCMLRGA